MSDRADVELDRFVAVRLVPALDALPIAPRGRPLGRGTAARPAPVLMFAMILLGVAALATWTPWTQTVGEAARVIRQLVSGGSFVGYYFDMRAPDADPRANQRVMFTAGTLPGGPTMPAVVGPSVVLPITGPAGGSDASWTADGEHLLLWAGARIYLGDRSGRVQQIADLGASFVVLRAGRLEAGGVLAVLGPAPESDGRGRWISRIRPGSPPEEPRLVPASIVVWGYPPASPDGRWLTVDVGRGTCTRSGFGASGVYDIDRGVVVDLVTAAGSPLMALGWTGDGRVVSAYCDAQRRAMDLFVVAPGDAPGVPLATVAWARGSPLPFVDPARDRVIAAPGGGPAPANLLGVALDGRQTVIAQLPPFASAESEGGPLLRIIYLRSMSRDERFLSFSITDANDRHRTGVIDLSTGQVSYACGDDRECYHMTLR